MPNISNTSCLRSGVPATTWRSVAIATSLAISLGAFLSAPAILSAQSGLPADPVLRISLAAGRSLPLTTPDPITKVAVANPDIADVVIITERDLVINGKASGETDIVLWAGTRPRLHYRVTVRAPSDRRMVLLSVRVAEVRRDMLTQLGISGLNHSKDGNTRVGTGAVVNDLGVGEDGKALTPTSSRFLSILADFGTKQFLAYLDVEQQNGRARLLAEPNLLAADRDSASFLAGGEIPIPVVQGGTTMGGVSQSAVSIQYREFGVRLRFSPDIVSDSVIKLYVRPEVSSLDYGNAVLLSGFRIPALRTRRVESTVDIRRDQSIILSGLFNEEREMVRTGVPYLMNIPVLGALFSSTRWQTAESELLVIVTPTIIEPGSTEGQFLFPLRPETKTPALDALRKRLPADTVKKP